VETEGLGTTTGTEIRPPLFAAFHERLNAELVKMEEGSRETYGRVSEKTVTLEASPRVLLNPHYGLAHFFGTSAEFRLNLQSLYDLGLAQEKAEKSIKALPTLKRRALVHA
jgi:hypothetical protein